MRTLCSLFAGIFCFAAAPPDHLSAAEFFPETATPLSNSEVDSLKTSFGSLTSSTGVDVVVIGDMMFRASDLLTTGFSGNKWTDGKFVYQFDSNVSPANQSRFLDACKAWEDVSAVECVQRTSEENFVHVLSSNFNRSFVGMIGGRQDLEIYNWNWKYIIAHEIGHALGLAHEQSRSDRDTYVEILFNNIRSGTENNFQKRSTTNHSPYDFRSIMHYGPLAFSKDGISPTIEPRSGYEAEGSHMGNRQYLSSQDAAGMASHYGPN